MNFGIHFLAQAEGTSGWMKFVNDVARTQLSNIVIFALVCTVLRLAVFPILIKTEFHRRDIKYKLARGLSEIMDAVIYASVFVFLVIRPFLLQTFFIPSGSMLETLQLNDFIIANKLVYRFSEPQVGDIIVFRLPKWAYNTAEGDSDFIKRCVAVPGQVIEVREGSLYRDGKRVEEPYLREKQIRFDFKLVEHDGEVWPVTMENGTANTSNAVAERYRVEPDNLKLQQELINAPAAEVPKGFVMAMGDNRNESSDGRFWGLVKRENVIGRSEFIWLPLRRIQQTR